MPGGHLRRVVLVLETVTGNRELRRVEAAFAAFNCAEWAVWIAMLVFAYHEGGATTAGLVALAQLVPAALVAPLASTLADRRGPARALELGYVAQALALAATAAALLAAGPPVLAYALAAVAATAVTLTRPAQAAALPALARRADELTAANVASGWIESVSILAAPAAAGVLLGVSSPGVVFAVMAALTAGAALLVAPVQGPAPATPTEPRGHEVLAAFAVLRREPSARLLVLLLGAQFVAIGALDVLYVVLALDTLDLGDAGAGYLNAAFGAGGTLGVVATAALVGRRRLVPPLVAGAMVWSVALIAVGVRESTAAALVLLAAAGASRAVFDVAGRTLLQRTAPTDVLARVFGILEGLTMAALAAGSLLAPALVAIDGARGGLIGVAILLPLLVLATAPRLGQADARASVPVVEIALLRASAIFAALPPPALERLARELEPLRLSPGDVLIRQGARGDRFYLIADGELDVDIDGVPVARRRRGEGVGEIALVRDVPRTATVRAATPAHVYALERAPFIAAVTGHAAAAAATDRVIASAVSRPADPARRGSGEGVDCPSQPL